MNPGKVNSGPGTVVLVNVDDNEGARYARTRLLQRAGFRVHDASRGDTALKLIQEVEPDLVLLDVNLPGMSGIDVCRAIKGNAATQSVIVLQISASAISAPQATEALNSGADTYLVEPVDADVLVATVRALLRLRTAEREVTRSNMALREANSRLEELNSALRRSNEDVERFAYIASHDLQEPLRTIATHLQLLERKLSHQLDQANREVFDDIVDAAHRMSDLIRDVLAYSRAGGDETVFQAVSLQDSLGWALNNLSESLASTNGEVISEALPVVWGDSTQLAQVFQNLIGNALKYRSSASPRVEIRSEMAADGEWLVSIRDNGIGIDPKHHDRIFRPFQRLHGREFAGTGIGLALCRRIIESHGGRIWVQSNSGSGATFVFSLRPAESTVARAI
jgi:signal transduction histidine kinase